MKTLLIDNYDSYTFNLYQLLAEVNGEEPIVVRNDQYDWGTLTQLPVENIVISPGPGTPQSDQDFGVCSDVLRKARVPVLGVCLGHQGVGFVSGADVVPAPEIMHGRLSRIYHDSSTLFNGLPQGFHAVRYHSLVVAHPLPSNLEMIAWTDDNIIMGLRHTTRPLWGVQFHPESVVTDGGRQLLTNFRDLTQRLRSATARAPIVSAGERRTRHASRLYQMPAQQTTASLLPGASGAKATSVRQAEVSQPTSTQVLVRRLETLYDAERTFLQLFAQETYAFWLDSSRNRFGATHPVTERASRFTFMGAATGAHDQVVSYDITSQRLTIRRADGVTYQSGGIFAYLEHELSARACDAPDLPFDFVGGFVGYFGYELNVECGATNAHHYAHHAQTPDAMFLFTDRFLAFDHHAGATYLVCLTRREERADADAWFGAIERRLRSLPSALQAATPTTGTPNARADDPVVFHLQRPYDTYIDNIHACQRYLQSGDTYEVCLTNQITTTTQVDPLATYRNLRHLNPAPYAAFLRLGSFAVLSSSPERFLRIDRARAVEAKPIKGTAARGGAPAEDNRLRDALRASEKERAEHLMIVDLLRNDLGRVCQIGSVCVPALMAVESYQTVHQLVSTVRGQLRPDFGVIDCIRAAFPGGSMTGAPKLRTMQIIDELEAAPRAIYAGALGFLSLNGTADLSMVIRTIVMAHGTMSIGVGGAIVAQSDPEREFDEMLLKARAPLGAIALTATGSGDERHWRISNGRAPKL